MLVLFSVAASVFAQGPGFTAGADKRIKIRNAFGRIQIVSLPEDGPQVSKAEFRPDKCGRLEVSGEGKTGSIYSVASEVERCDLVATVSPQTRIDVATVSGELTISGIFAETRAETETGTIYLDSPAENIKYKFLWTGSYPRFMSDAPLEKIKEKSAGRFQISGVFGVDENKIASRFDREPAPMREVELRTSRGIILFNVPPDKVPNDLLPKKMTQAALAILRSGDSQLALAIRRAAPELDDGTETAVHLAVPVLKQATKKSPVLSRLKRLNLQVVDRENRAISGLSAEDFQITERGRETEILKIEKSETAFNLLLLVDVSGSVANYVDFIRKAGRSFVNTADPKDRVAIVAFNEEVQKLSSFTTDKGALSESLNTFEAGGGTALYDAIGFGLSDILRPLGGERTAIVILSDGDDNRSFLSYSALAGSIEESGALIFPMYVPSSLVAASGDYTESAISDPVRAKYLTGNLSTKATKEGEDLARISGGRFYPISKLSELERAYGDIVSQLRTAYTITYKSDLIEDIGDKASPRLKVSVKGREAFVRLGTVTAVEGEQ
ncbi:MAG: VWA domain-containing protein [Pyrinomonadaceae bacterium]